MLILPGPADACQDPRSHSSWGEDHLGEKGAFTLHSCFSTSHILARQNLTLPSSTLCEMGLCSPLWTDRTGVAGDHFIGGAGLPLGRHWRVRGGPQGLLSHPGAPCAALSCSPPPAGANCCPLLPAHTGGPGTREFPALVVPGLGVTGSMLKPCHPKKLAASLVELVLWLCCPGEEMAPLLRAWPPGHLHAVVQGTIKIHCKYLNFKKLLKFYY